MCGCGGCAGCGPNKTNSMDVNSLFSGAIAAAIPAALCDKYYYGASTNESLQTAMLAGAASAISDLITPSLNLDVGASYLAGFGIAGLVYSAGGRQLGFYDMGGSLVPSFLQGAAFNFVGSKIEAKIYPYVAKVTMAGVGTQGKKYNYFF